MPLIELESRKTTEAISLESATDGSVEHQLPLTRKGWNIVENATCGDDVILTSADGSVFLGTVQDTDEDRYRLYIELR
jgi:hypothetical protein